MSRVYVASPPRAPKCTWRDIDFVRTAWPDLSYAEIALLLGTSTDFVRAIFGRKKWPRPIPTQAHNRAREAAEAAKRIRASASAMAQGRAVRNRARSRFAAGLTPEMAMGRRARVQHIPISTIACGEGA